MPIRSILSLLFFAGMASTQADVKLPAIFGDHMVLQQDTKLPVWGWAEPGEKITVTFGNQTAETAASTDGKWRVDLPAVPAGTPAGSLVVSGKNTITLTDVLVGDVWICSGQSNMVFGLRQRNSYKGPEAAKQANHPQIRLFLVTKSGQPEPVETFADAPFDSPLQGHWQVCTPETVTKIGDFTDQDEGGFSAVGYFFAKAIHEMTQRPVGMIGSYVGGTGADAWTSLAGLKKEPALDGYVQKLAKPTEDQKRFYSIKWADYVAAYQKWKAVMKEPMDQWAQAATAAKKVGQPEPPKPVNPEPRPQNLNSILAPPASLFNGMISPLIPYAIKGVIWYQGENNTGRAEEYGTLLPALIRDWRAHWNQGDFPFLFVQLPNSNEPPKSAGEPSTWAVLRESQSRTLALPNTGMAVTIDVGAVGLHPPDKFDIAARLALVARKVAYGENLVATGPIYDAMKIEGNQARVGFRPGSIGGGLTIGKSPWHDTKATPQSETELQGFALAGEDQKWVWATAKIDGDTILVSSPEVPNPVAVRYAWANNPTINLYNKEGLPAAPFRTDNWNPPAPTK